MPHTVPNVATAMIPPTSVEDLPPNLPKHQAYMAFEGVSPLRNPPVYLIHP